ncbi:MAG: efflux RND transporter periplasmic adaptor subunit [Anaerolineales bacterium]|nr:efflux RND transporter periplasmic adaptor subunit [Anaerolineales bacterium]MDW8277933.1 efflux RND transporter periplasmic adaptor subunit [Anaerolineales bacterium]
MNHNRPPVPVIIIVLLAIFGAAAYFLWPQFQPAAETGLTASGTVETVQTSIAPEVAGKVLEVLVEEGDSVSAGQVLLRLDPSLLEAQRALAASNLASVKAAVVTAEAALASAQAQYDLTVQAALTEEAAVRAADWKLSKPTEFDQPSWYFTRAEQLTAAEAERAAARQSLDKAADRLASYQKQTAGQDFLEAERRLAAARAAYDLAKSLLDSTSGADQTLRDAAQTRFDDAQSELEDAQKAYDDLLTTEAAQDILEARADLRLAQERADRAADRLRALQTGLNSPKVLAAQKVVEQAEAALSQAKTAVAQAEANLKVIETQIAKLTLTAPADGVILTRSVQPGEVVSPGSVALTLANLSDLTLTVYIPEDRYGEVTLGQTVSVTVDSFPGETFRAIVVHISDRAEFTPRNVQTVEGRKTTVFAIKLRLDDPQGKLKPGMPADVRFSNQ